MGGITIHSNWQTVTYLMKKFHFSAHHLVNCAANSTKEGKPPTIKKLLTK